VRAWRESAYHGSMKLLSWSAVVIVLVACKVDEPAKKAAEGSSGGGGRPAAPAVAEGSATAAAGSATPDAATGEDEDSRPLPSCEDAIANGMDSFEAGPESAGFKEALQAVYTRRCLEDRWPAAVLRCHGSATSMTAMKLCRGKLPRDQSAKLQAEIMRVMNVGLDKTPPSGPVPVGGPPTTPLKLPGGTGE
jgi:hypothetical protein